MMPIIRSTLKKVFVATLAVLSIAVIISPFPPAAYAVSGSEFQAGRIIDDAIFTNANAMSVHEIKLFLNAKVPSCDNWGTQPYGGTTRRAYSESKGVSFPLTCLKDYFENPSTRENNLQGRGIPSGAKNAAQIIFDAGQLHNINPQVLLVLLQKEQNLVYDDWPWPTQFQKATGYACPDTAPCDSQYFGFYNQVDSAARQFKRYATTPQSFNFIAGTTNNVRFNPTAACGASPVYIQNQATASLYNYTPYQPNGAALANLYGSGDDCSAYGNRNFWRFFNDWFGTTISGRYASPLYKASDSPTIFAIAEGKKYPVPNYAVMVNYGYQKYPVAIVDASFLNSYATQPPLTSIAKKADDPSGTLYMFDDGKRYPIQIKDCRQYPDGTAVAATTWSLDCFNGATTLTLPNQLIDNYTSQDIPLPQVILYGDAAWKIEGGKKRRITHGAFIDVLGGWSQVRWMKDINAAQPQGKLLILDDSIVKFDNSSTLYFLNNGSLYPVQGPGEYAAWNLGKKPAFSFPASFNSDPIPTTAPIQFFAKTSSEQNYLLTLDGRKVALGAADNWNIGSDYSSGLTGAVNQIPLASDSGLFRSDNGAIFTVFSKKKYLFPTTEDLFYLGFDANRIINVSSKVENTLTYGGAHLSAGRLFKVAGSDSIRYIIGGASLRVDSTNYPGLPYSKLITVDEITSARYPIVGTYRP